jgi:hypothetical protein
MRRYRYSWRSGPALVVAGLVAVLGCQQTPIDQSELGNGSAPLQTPSAAVEAGGHIFEMYCGYCHNARSLAERPFSNYQNAAQHMRVRANLTGEEYAKLMAWLRRWHDVPAAEQRETPAPNRLFFSQPIPELRDQRPSTASDLPGGPRPGATSEASPGQPPAGSGPQEGR